MASSARECLEDGCHFFANASLYCSQHNPEQVAARAAAEVVAAPLRAAAAEEERERARESIEWWGTVPRNATNGRRKKYLVLGATPDEFRNGRTHYDNTDVYLLGDEPARNTEGIDYTRYLVASYSPEHAGDLRELAHNYKSFFNEMTFDQSTMCAFHNDGDSVRHRFESLSIMLKPNGILYLSDTSSYLQTALQEVGFDVRKLRVRDLGPDSLPSMIHFGPELEVTVGVLRGMGRGAPRGPRARKSGGKRKTHKKKSRRKTKKLSSYSTYK